MAYESQSDLGESLPGLYDTKGTLIGPGARLVADEIFFTHELGHVAFSERLSSQIRRATGNIAQSSAFGVSLTDLPNVPFRVAGIVVWSDDATAAADFTSVTASLVDPDVPREIPIWAFAGASGALVPARVNIPPATDVQILTPAADLRVLPAIGVGDAAPENQRRVRDFVLRGNTGAFGAGTRNINADLLIYFAQKPGPNPGRGLPIPSW